MLGPAAPGRWRPGPVRSMLQNPVGITVVSHPFSVHPLRQRMQSKTIRPGGICQSSAWVASAAFWLVTHGTEGNRRCLAGSTCSRVVRRTEDLLPPPWGHTASMGSLSSAVSADIQEMLRRCRAARIEVAEVIQSRRMHRMSKGVRSRCSSLDAAACRLVDYSAGMTG